MIREPIKEGLWAGVCAVLCAVSVGGCAAPETSDEPEEHGDERTGEAAQQVTSVAERGRVAVGLYHSIAIDQNGMVRAWGRNTDGQLGDNSNTTRLTPVAVVNVNLPNVVAVAAGHRHSLALRADGEVYAWGDNASGQLGTGTFVDSKTPVNVLNLSNVVAIAAGADYSIALRADGTVWTWGGNFHGQLGDGTTTQRPTVDDVPGLTQITAVVAGASHVLALHSDGTASAWGKGAYGQLGDGTTWSRTSPVTVLDSTAVGPLTDVAALAGGGDQSLALLHDGTVRSWGRNTWGQLGNGIPGNRTTPGSVPDLDDVDVVAISAGFGHSLAVSQGEDDHVYAWGRNESGQLGDGTLADQWTPVEVYNLPGALSVFAGYYHSHALRPNGNISGWGDNAYGQLGDGTTTDRLTPVNVLSFYSFRPRRVAAGHVHTLAVGPGGTVRAAGSNWSGQLGIGPGTSTSSTPVTVSTLSLVASVAAGREHSLAAKADGSVYAWGSNGGGQLGFGAMGGTAYEPGPLGIDDAVDVAAGEYHSMALRSDGTVLAWGWNDAGQLGDNTTTARVAHAPVQDVSGTDLSGVVAIAAGASHSLALLSNGTVRAWGKNDVGQLGDTTLVNRKVAVHVKDVSGSDVGNIVAIAAGGSHSMALRSDGRVYVWGSNASVELCNSALPDQTSPYLLPSPSNVVAIAAGAGHSLVVRASGAVYSCGSDSDGQLGHNSPGMGMMSANLGNAADVIAGTNQSFALLGNGELFGWGDNGSGELGVGSYTDQQVPVATSFP